MDHQPRRESVHRRDSVPSILSGAPIPRRESIQPSSPNTSSDAQPHRRESLQPTSPNTSPAPPPTPVVQSGIGSSPQRHQIVNSGDDDDDDAFSVTESYIPDSNASESNLTTFDQASNASELSVLLDRPQHVISLRGRGSVSGGAQQPLGSANWASGQRGKEGDNQGDLSPHG